MAKTFKYLYNTTFHFIYRRDKLVFSHEAVVIFLFLKKRNYLINDIALVACVG